MADRENVIKGLEAVLDWLSEGEDRKCVAAYRAVEDALELLKEQEVVVRCKDCKYCEYPKSKKEWCKKGHLHRNAETWFCADGERL